MCACVFCVYVCFFLFLAVGIRTYAHLLYTGEAIAKGGEAGVNTTAAAAAGATVTETKRVTAKATTTAAAAPIAFAGADLHAFSKHQNSPSSSVLSLGEKKYMRHVLQKTVVDTLYL